VLIESEIAVLEDGAAVLADGRRLTTDVVLVAAGIEPATGLAGRAGLEVARGVLVDDRLRTSDERIFAAGDLAEWRGSILGLWPVAVEQAEVAAENAVGGTRTYAGTVPVTMLKVVGVELLSVGAVSGPREIADADPESLRYRKLVLDDEDRVTGAILLGHPELTPAVTAAVRQRRPAAELDWD
jgi:NAD(P)H-nitrite reductase large subunit